MPHLDEGEDYYELSESLTANSNLEVFMPGDWDTIYIGRSWSSIGDDETGKELKESVKKEIKKVFEEEIKAETIEEAYYN